MEPIVLSDHEQKLLQEALPFIKNAVNSTGKLPSREQIRRYLKCREISAGAIQNYIIQEKLVPLPPKVADAGAPTSAPSLKEVNKIDKDTWDITLPKTHIHTLPDLLKFFEVDETVWEVERFVANKWEMGYIATSHRVKNGNEEDHTNESGVQPLYQVKAFLRRKRFSTLEHYAVDNARLRRQVEKLRLEVNAERGMVKRLAQNHCGYDDFSANIKDFVATLGDFSIPSSYVHVGENINVPAVAKGHDEDAVLMLSDTHFGDVIRREDTSGFPEFDLVISANRFGYVIQKAKQVLAIHRCAYPIKRLYVWVGGDIGNGMLHDSPNSNALFMPAQVHFSYVMFKNGIEDLLALTRPDPQSGNRTIEEIVLLFTVGNHMRVDEKMPHKYQAQRTLDWLIYQSLIEHFSGKPGIRIRTEMSPFIFETIRGHRHLFCHGMQVGFRNSPDAQNKAISNFLALARATFDSPEWRRKNGLEGETFSRACIGDIHIPISFPRFISNGSLNGQNELGVNWQLEPIPAGQQIWGVSDKHQETWNYFLECTHIQRAEADFNAYGVFAAEYSKRIGRGS